MSDRIKDVNDGNFEQVVLQSEVPVLVDFWAAWCGPCRTLEPTVAAIAEKHANSARFVKLNVDDNTAVTQRYGIRAIPTLILFEDGKETERLTGVVSEEEISRKIGKHLKAELN